MLLEQMHEEQVQRIMAIVQSLPIYIKIIRVFSRDLFLNAIRKRD